MDSQLASIQECQREEEDGEGAHEDADGEWETENENDWEDCKEDDSEWEDCDDNDNDNDNENENENENSQLERNEQDVKEIKDNKAIKEMNHIEFESNQKQVKFTSDIVEVKTQTKKSILKSTNTTKKTLDLKAFENENALESHLQSNIADCVKYFDTPVQDLEFFDKVKSIHKEFEHKQMLEEQAEIDLAVQNDPEAPKNTYNVLKKPNPQ